MKRLITLVLTFSSASLSAGNGGGIGTPPALQDEMSMLMNSSRNLALRLDEQNQPILLSKSELPPSFTLDASELKSAEAPATLILSAGQFVETVETESLKKKSYVVKDGDELGSYELQDRLTRARDALKNSTLNQ